MVPDYILRVGTISPAPNIWFPKHWYSYISSANNAGDRSVGELLAPLASSLRKPIVARLSAFSGNHTQPSLASLPGLKVKRSWYRLIEFRAD